MEPAWTDTVTAVATAIGVLLTAAGLVFVAVQLRAVRHQMRLATYEQLYSRMHEIHTLFVQCPELRSYLYDGKDCETSAENHQQVCAAAEMMADFFQQVNLQLDLMPPKTAEGWRAYMHDIAARSPMLQRHLKRNAQWYPSRLLEITDIETPVITGDSRVGAEGPQVERKVGASAEA